MQAPQLCQLVGHYAAWQWCLPAQAFRHHSATAHQQGHANTPVEWEQSRWEQRQSLPGCRHPDSLESLTGIGASPNDPRDYLLTPEQQGSMPREGFGSCSGMHVATDVVGPGQAS